MNTAEFLVMIATYWAWTGAAVALVFLLFGIDRIDEDAQDAYVFRPLLIPGVVLIWPLVLWRWYRLETGSDNWSRRYQPRRHRHKYFAYAMPIAIVLIIVAGLSARQQWPADIAPEQLAAPAEVSQ